MHGKAVLKVEDGKFIADVNTYMHNLDNGYTLQMLSIFMYMHLYFGHKKHLGFFQNCDNYINIYGSCRYIVEK